MLHSGLVSVTFRKLAPKEITLLAARAGLDGIEWGGDIHVPHGNNTQAGEVVKWTEEAGLKTAAYGSYYTVGCGTKDGTSFEQVLETAAELKAPVIRVWAGDRGSREAEEGWWETVIDDTRRISGLAEKVGIRIAFEYHGGTLTDTGDAALRLMKAVGGGNTSCCWQPPVGLDVDGRMEGLGQILPWLANIHVFWWKEYERLPLAEGVETWKKYMEPIRKLTGDRYCMLEFVQGDEPEQFLKDAEALKQILHG